MRAGAQEENGCGEEPLAAQRLLGQAGVHLVALKRACACLLSPKRKESPVWLRLPALEAGPLGVGSTSCPCPCPISPPCSQSQSYCPQLVLRGGERWEPAG